VITFVLFATLKIIKHHFEITFAKRSPFCFKDSNVVT